MSAAVAPVWVIRSGDRGANAAAGQHAIGVGRPALGDRLAALAGVVNLAARYGGVGNVPHDCALPASRGGDGPWVRADALFTAAPRRHGGAGIGRQNRQAAVRADSPGDVCRGAEVVRIAHRTGADAMQLGAFDTSLHGAVGEQLAEPIMAVDHEHSAFVRDYFRLDDRGCRAARETVQVPGQVQHPMGRMSLQLHGRQRVVQQASILGWDPVGYGSGGGELAQLGDANGMAA